MNNNLRETPCLICGKQEFEWGVLAPIQNFFSDEEPFVRRLTRMKSKTRVRCCLSCGNLQHFTDREDIR